MMCLLVRGYDKLASSVRTHASDHPQGEEFTLLSSDVAEAANRRGDTHLESHHRSPNNRSGARQLEPSPPALPPPKHDTHVASREVVCA